MEGPAGALLPPATAGADTLPALPPPAESPRRPAAAPRPPVAASAGVTFGRTGETLQVMIRVAGGAATKLSRSQNEVLLSFPGALPQFNSQALLDQANGLLTGVSVGFDTLLLQLAPGIGVARTDEDGSTIRLVIQPGLATGDTAPPDQGDLRLRLLEAQLLARTGDNDTARTRLETLRPQMSDSPEPLTALAGLDLQRGRWRLALSELQQAQQLDPGNPAIDDAIAAINRTQGSRVRTDFEYRQTDGGLGAGRATALIEGLSGHQLFGDGWRIGFASDLTQVDAAQVRRVDGRVTKFSATLGRTEIFLQHDGLDGNIVGGSLYSNGDTVGAGLRGELPDASGVTLLRAEYHRPNWDFFESIINQGTRDRAALGRRQDFGHDITGRFEVAVNRYNVEGLSDVDRTVTVTGELRLGNLAGVRGLSVAYVLDGEYVFKQSNRIAPDGTLYTPLSLVDREVHALTLSYAGTFGSAGEGVFTYEASGGYGLDRYGKGGPLLGAVVGYSKGHFDGRLRASYVENIGRARGMTQIYGGSLAWIF